MADVSNELEKLITEVRTDFQIPPYAEDSTLKRLAGESIAYFNLLRPGCDYRTDKTYRELLENRIYYAWNHALSDFTENYAASIITWQAESEYLGPSDEVEDDEQS